MISGASRSVPSLPLQRADSLRRSDPHHLMLIKHFGDNFQSRTQSSVVANKVVCAFTAQPSGIEHFSIGCRHTIGDRSQRTRTDSLAFKGQHTDHDDMDKTKWPAICGLVAGTIFLSRTVPTIFAFDKPIHTSIVLLASCAATIIAFSRILPKDGGRSHRGQQYDALPLEEVGQIHTSRQSSPATEGVGYPSSLRKLRILFLVLVTTIGLRVETLRQILTNPQCASRTWEPLLPLVFALWDYWTVQRHHRRVLDDDPDANVYDALEQYLVRTRYGYVFAAALVSLGGMLALGITTAPPSTYICAASLPHRWRVPLLQHAGTLLDIAIVHCIGQLLHQREARGTRSVRLRFMSVAWALLVRLSTW